MPRARKVEPFLLAVVDDEKGVFSIEGPMVDDTPWIKLVCKAQEAKRPIRCMTLGSDEMKAESDLVRTRRWKRVPAGSIISLYLD